MTNDPKRAGQDFAKYLKLLPASVLAENNRKALAEAEKEAQAFSTEFSAGRCYVCGQALSSFNRDKPCLHWFLKPEGFEKDDLPRITEHFSLEQVERFLRRVANQEAVAKNINDMAAEGTGKLIEFTAKYKNLEWSISCAQSDYDGHEGASQVSKQAHYHLQMRVDEKRYIDYNDFHIALHDSDIKIMEAMREVPNYRARRLSGVPSMAKIFIPEAIEQLAILGMQQVTKMKRW